MSTMSSPAREHYLSEFKRSASTLPGAHLAWLARIRNDAQARFADHGFPDIADEDWKYTRLAALENLNFLSWPQAARRQRLACVMLNRLKLAPAHLLVFVNGRYAPAWSAPGRLPAGVQLVSLSQLLNHAPGRGGDSLAPYLRDERGQTVFGALNTALMADGAYLHIASGVALEDPVHLLFLTTQAQSSHPRTLIVAEAGAQASVIEHHAGRDDLPYFSNALTQIFCGEQAAIMHCKLQQEGMLAFHIAGVHARQQAASRLESHAFSLGAVLSRHDISTAFEAADCSATLNGLYLGTGRQHLDHHIRIDHIQAGGTSRAYYRGILDGRSHAVFDGKVVVHPGGQGTDAHQANHNLLLSGDAEVDSKPQLEIHADDVRCTHGATVGQLDEQQIFYLRSRGLEPALASSILVRAFAQDVIARVKLPSLRQRLEEMLSARLPQAEPCGEAP